MKLKLPESVRIVEVGPRDGLQNETVAIPTDVKVAFIRALAEAGLREIEVSSFVHPKAVPQLADAEAVIAALPPARWGLRCSFVALVPNMKGLERAIAAEMSRIAVFTAASDTFARKNIQMSIDESLEEIGAVVRRAKQEPMGEVRGYLSTAFACPYEGNIPRERVRELTMRLLELGVSEVAISDTIGAAAPRDVFETVGYVLEAVPADCLALHFHDTYGTAMANVLAGLQLGISTFDSSAGGLGGCPFAPGAAGNLATEDLVYMLERMGVRTGVVPELVCDAAEEIARHLGRELPSRHAARRRKLKAES